MNVEPNWLDNAISTFSAVWGVKRIAARYIGNMLTVSEGYTGAKKRRPYEKELLRVWLPVSPSWLHQPILLEWV